ncbi:MAG: cysteine desulfurase [Dehalococcoidia bacterium]|nr:cysteine desulfurase [Dehalococcoidia bacterium]
MAVRALYFDHAATSPVRPAALAAMLPYFTERFGNASSIYAAGRVARKALDEAREAIASVLGCRPAELIFTSGGTESDNTAIAGVAFAARPVGNHIVTTAVEHHAVLHTCDYLQRFGFEVTTVPVDAHGRVDPDAVDAAVRETTVLVSVMLANNEVGAIQPIREISDRLRRRARPIPLHTDAVQAPGYLSLDVDELGVDLLSLSAHKFGGPKGVGVLYVRKGVPFLPQMYGGSQERNRRAGTENIPGVVGMAVALREAEDQRPVVEPAVRALRDRLIDGVLRCIPGSRLHGHPVERLANNACFGFEGVDSESLLLALDLAGIAASSGSACTSASLEPSHVLVAMGVQGDMARGGLRLTLGPETTMAEVQRVLDVLPPIVARLRAGGEPTS